MANILYECEKCHKEITVDEDWGPYELDGENICQSCLEDWMDHFIEQIKEIRAKFWKIN